jgi:hypothetical protein
LPLPHRRPRPARCSPSIRATFVVFRPMPIPDAEFF